MTKSNEMETNNDVAGEDIITGLLVGKISQVLSKEVHCESNAILFRQDEQYNEAIALRTDIKTEM